MLGEFRDFLSKTQHEKDGGAVDERKSIGNLLFKLAHNGVSTHQKLLKVCVHVLNETKKKQKGAICILYDFSHSLLHRQTSFALFFLLLFSPVHSTIAPESEKNSMLYYAVLWEIPKRARKKTFLSHSVSAVKGKSVCFELPNVSGFPKIIITIFSRAGTDKHTPHTEPEGEQTSPIRIYVRKETEIFAGNSAGRERAKGDCDFCFFADGAIALRLRSTMIFLIDLFPCSPA